MTRVASPILTRQLMLSRNQRMEVWVLMVMARMVVARMVMVRGQRWSHVSMRVLEKCQVQRHQQWLHEQAAADQDCDESLN